MLNQTLYPAIFQRKSIRSYSDVPLSPEQLGEIKAEIAAVQSLLPGERFQLELAPAKGGWRIFGYCEDTPLGNVNLGYVLQQLDLSLFLKGYGRLWYGFGRDPRAGHAQPGLSYAMCLKVGNAAEPLAREIDAFDRKDITEVAEPVATAFEAVRLAPSAMNSQPWKFMKEGDAYHVFCIKPGIKKIVGLGRMNQVDIGICLCHAALGFGQEGKAICPQSLEKIEAPAGYYYVLSLEV